MTNSHLAVQSFADAPLTDEELQAAGAALATLGYASGANGLDLLRPPHLRTPLPATVEGRVRLRLADGQERVVLVPLAPGATGFAVWLDRLRFELENTRAGFVQIGEGLYHRDELRRVEPAAEGAE